MDLCRSHSQMTQWSCLIQHSQIWPYALHFWYRMFTGRNLLIFQALLFIIPSTLSLGSYYTPPDLNISARALVPSSLFLNLLILDYLAHRQGTTEPENKSQSHVTDFAWCSSCWANAGIMILSTANVSYWGFSSSWVPFTYSASAPLPRLANMFKSCMSVSTSEQPSLFLQGNSNLLRYPVWTWWQQICTCYNVKIVPNLHASAERNVWQWSCSVVPWQHWLLHIMPWSPKMICLGSS